MQKLIISVFVVFSVALISLSKVIPIPPTQESLRGAWLGISSDGIDFYRLVLRGQTGLLAFCLVGDVPDVYKIDALSVSADGRMTINSSPVSKDGYLIDVAAKAQHSQIKLLITGRDRKWSREVILFREESVERNFSRLKSAMETSEGRRSEPTKSEGRDQ